MMIMGLDLATNTGFAYGRTGATYGNGLTVGCVTLKKPEDDLEKAPAELAKFLRDLWAVEAPDLVVYEAPLSGFVQSEKGRPASAASLEMPPLLKGALLGVAGCFDVPCVFYQPNTIRKWFLGYKPDGRKETKEAVIKQAILEKLTKPYNRNDNIADAAACWLVGQMKHAGYRAPRAEIRGLFAEPTP